MSESFVREVDLHLTVEAAHRLETAQLMARVERLTAVVREHGLALPGEDPSLGASDGEHLAACRRVVDSAYQLLSAISHFEENLHILREMVGSGMELVNERSWRK